MVQASGPLVGQAFTDEQWRRVNGRQGIVQDYTGTGYGLTLPTGTNDAQVAAGKSVVAGFGHEVPTGQTHTVTIPDSTNAAVGRTDVIAVAYDPAYSTDPGPCRLLRVAGTEGSAALPVLDMIPPGVEVMPLWAVTRKQGQSLNQAARRDLRRWEGPTLFSSESSPTGSYPLGTTVLCGDLQYHRRLGVAGTPEWLVANLSDSRGEPPSVVVSRSTFFDVAPATQWVSLSAETTNVGGDTGKVGLSVVGGNTQQNPGRIRIAQAGLYAIGYRLRLNSTVPFRAEANLGVFAGPGFSPVSQLPVTNLDHPGPQGGQLAQQRYLSDETTRWVRAGTDIGIRITNTADLRVNSWLLYATWLGN